MKKILSIILSAMLLTSFSGCNKTSTAQGVTADKIVVGNCAATSGAYAPVGVPFINGIQAYFMMVNEGGGINGRKIEYVHKDDEFDPVKGKAYVQELINDTKVFAIVGHFGTPVVGATLDDIKEAGIPTVYFATGIGQLFNEKAEGKDKVIFPVQPIYKTEGQIMVARAKGDFSAKKVGVIYTNDDAGKDLLWGVEKECATQNIEVVKQQVAVGSSDVSAAVTAIKQENVDVVIGAEIQATFPTVVKELAAQSVNKPIITTYVNASDAITKAVSNEVKGKFDVYANAWVDLTGERAQELEKYREWIKKFSNSEEYASNTYAMTGWIAAHFFVEGVKNVKGDLTWESYITALESAPIKNPFGGTIDFSGGKRFGTQEMSLTKLDPANPLGWAPDKPLQSIQQILGN